MGKGMPDAVRRWLDAAIEDAKERGLPELAPLLEGLARSTAILRAADWNDSVASRTSTRNDTT